MSYDANSIQVKNFRDAARSSPGLYLGADGQDAMFNCFLEILNNACDEAIMGRGKEIIVEVTDNTLKVSDAGAGVPRGKNATSDEVLIDIYSKEHSSGKFNANSNYSRVRGVFGVGSSTVCVCSKNFEVWTKRDGAEWYLQFKDGIPQDTTARPLRKTKETGTTIYFEPDKKIFHLDEATPSFQIDRIRNELRLTSYFIPNVAFILRDGTREDCFFSKNGLKDFAEAQITNPLHKNYIYANKHFDGNIDIEVFAQWTSEKERCFVFTNGAANINGGVPVSGMKTAFTRTINDLSKNKFDSDMIRKGLVTIINIKHPNPIFKNQVKDQIVNAELRGQTQTVFTEAIKDWALKHSDELDKIIGLLSKEQKAEDAAAKAREAVLNHEKEMTAKKNKVIQSKKLRDARKLGQESMLVIVEGDSAGGSISTGRQESKTSDNIGILMLRGKCINALANPLDKVLGNEEVKLLLQALGLIYGQKYNSKKLRYGKIAICTDAD